MSLKYVLNSLKHRKLRTTIVAIALIFGVRLVGALLALVDTQRQFSVHAVGAQTGNYDLSIRLSDLAPGPFFDIAQLDQLVHHNQVAAIYPRIQGNAQAHKPSGNIRERVTVVALDVDKDKLSTFTLSDGSYPPQPGQVFLTQPAADLLGAHVGDEVLLSYIWLAPREEGKAAVEASTRRSEGRFIVSGIGVISGFGDDVGSNAVLRLDDAQRWLEVPKQAERLLVVWHSDTSAGSDAQLAVSRARDVAARVTAALQANLGPNYVVELAKYEKLDDTAESYIFRQTYITLYGLLSMGIVGLMVNALMMTTVAEQKHDLAILRVIGSPRARLFEAVVIEVILLGVIGVIFGLLLGRAINDYVTLPLLHTRLQLPLGVHAQWSLQSVLTPTLITAAVLAVATISPARAAAATKVMVVLNPAAADQPTLEDLQTLRERRASHGLLVGGFVLLAFCGIILFIFPILSSFGDLSAQATVYYATYLLMVVGTSLVFYFLTTPLERALIAIFKVFNPRATFFASRYALRGKGRNALISLMVVTSAVLPSVLATQLALTDANIETDVRFTRGADAAASPSGTSNNVLARVNTASIGILSDANLSLLRAQPGISNVVGIADAFRSEASDHISLRTANVGLIGVRGNLNDVLFTNLIQWAAGDASALARINQDPNAVIISGGLSEDLDLRVGDTLSVKGAGFDHERMLTIVGVLTRLPGFRDQITRNRNNAEAGDTSILMNLDTYRDLRHDPAIGPVGMTEALYSRALLRLDPHVDETGLARTLRENLTRQHGIAIAITNEFINSYRVESAQGRNFVLLLTVLSMLTATLGVLAVMYTAVMGRRVEIGMLKAVGAAARTLRSIFIGEAMVTTLSSALAGILAGTILGYAFEVSQRFAQENLMVLAFDPMTAGLIVLLVCIAAAFSAALAMEPVLRSKASLILMEK